MIETVEVDVFCPSARSRRAVSPHWRAALGFTLLVGIFNSPDAEAQSGQPVPTAPTQIPAVPVPPAAPARGFARVLTISGGISLGAYEAGYNWAFVRYLKQMKEAKGDERAGYLAGVTGASAGNINAFLTAIAWCQVPAMDAQESLESNLFWRTWIGIGWEKLFPVREALLPTREMSCEEYRKKFDPELPSDYCGAKPDAPAYLPDDGLLTRRAFASVEQEIASRVVGPRNFSPGCALPLGITVTKVIPDTLQLEKLKIGTQRFAIALQAESDDSGLGFYTGRVKEDEQRVGKYLNLPAGSSKRVNVALMGDGSFSLFDAIEASSAFPVAFGPKTLEYCVKDSGTPSALCADGQKLVSAQFIDGGVFDNVPLGLATTLVTRMNDGLGVLQPWRASKGGGRFAANERLQFHYIDPTTLRFSRPQQIEPQEKRGRNLDYLGGLLGNVVSVARQYELQTVQRFGLPEGTGFALSSRYSRIVGEQLGAFGAFVAKPFREYDYYVGVYDAIQNFAEETCKPETDDVRRSVCIIQNMVETHELLKVGDSPSASYVFRRLMARELELDHGADLAKLVMTSVPVGEGTVSTWVDAQKAPNLLLERLVAIGARGAHTQDEKEDSLWRFQEFLEELHGNSEVKDLGVELSADETLALTESEDWLWENTAQVLERLSNIERADLRPGDSTGLGLPLLGLGGVAARTRLSSSNIGLEWSPGSATGGARAFPNFLTLFPIKGGLELGYRPTYGISRWFALSFPLVPVTYWSDSHVGAAAGVAANLRFRWAFISGVEVGARGSYDYWYDGMDRHGRWFDKAGVGYGFEASVFFLENKLRAGVQVRPIYGTFPRDLKAEMTLGITDLNGFVQWSLGLAP